ncbi:hypothetical protein IFT66_22110 [Rhizobium sp. CFBP 13726]|uniref:hypothetical protein n=1 Tax=Rhizobium sp. CFBP 13726 TaxID=2775296 RepID=UPI0017800A32|nr:hypothetical protein [Rhizobium sp. CFBP 13726]MBD8653794.1 hypothetical protein [Rhizobium sp. CFBP 13726]
MRKIVVFAVAALALSASFTAAQILPTLGERRAISAVEKDKFPAVQKRIQDAAGFEVAIKVDWNSLALPGDDQYYGQDDYLVKTVFLPIENAMKNVAKDAMGKEALKAKLTTINIHYIDAGISASAYKDRVKFGSGTLDINFRPFTNSADVDERTNAIISVLEAAL